MAETSVVMSAE
jgi:hypothetical protein